MWQVTEIVPVNKTKSRIFLDGRFAFVLYNRECSSFGIEEGKMLADERYQALLDVLKKRALKYAVYILEASDRTEGQIRDKLYSAGYPVEVADYVVDKLCGYRYINDMNYAWNFVIRNHGIMNVREMENKLYGKKVPADIMKEVMDMYKSEFPDADEEAFLYAFKKKGIVAEALNIKEKQKLAAYFARKGFSHDLIKKYLDADDLYSY